jgi:peroxiredoxin
MLSGPVAEERISPGREPPEQGADFVRRQALAFPVLLDPEGRVQERCGAYQFPVFSSSTVKGG